jgi:RsiW-degrading membrane proteinase PrsW (M82 family)
MPNLIGWFPGANPFQAALLISFGMAAVPEELMKFAVVRFYAARHRQFNEPLDGMVYGVVAALGFAATENIAYSLNQGWGVTLFRSCTAIPLHAAVGAIMGHYVAGSRFARPGERRSLGRALLIPIMVHACYDFPLFAGKLAHEAQHPWAQRVWFDAALQCLALAVLASAIHEAMQHWRQARDTEVSRSASTKVQP